MEHDPFRPHWVHSHCGGVVTGFGDVFKCLKCGTAAAVGAVLPPGVANSLEYFNSHPDVEVDFVNRETNEAASALHELRNMPVKQRIGRKLRRWREKIPWKKTQSELLNK